MYLKPLKMPFIFGLVVDVMFAIYFVMVNLNKKNKMHKLEKMKSQTNPFEETQFHPMDYNRSMQNKYRKSTANDLQWY